MCAAAKKHVCWKKQKQSCQFDFGRSVASGISIVVLPWFGALYASQFVSVHTFTPIIYKRQQPPLSDNQPQNSPPRNRSRDHQWLKYLIDYIYYLTSPFNRVYSTPDGFGWYASGSSCVVTKQIAWNTTHKQKQVDKVVERSFKLEI